MAGRMKSGMCYVILRGLRLSCAIGDRMYCPKDNNSQCFNHDCFEMIE